MTSESKTSPEEIAKRICKEMSVTELDYEMSCKQFEIPIAEAIRAERECIVSVVKQTIDNLPCPKCAQLRDAWCSPECAFKTLRAERERASIPSIKQFIDFLGVNHANKPNAFFVGAQIAYDWLASQMSAPSSEAKTCATAGSTPKVEEKK